MSHGQPKCNVEAYLEQEEINCRRMAISTRHTQQGEQWLAIAKALLDARQNHGEGCTKCRRKNVA